MSINYFLHFNFRIGRGKLNLCKIGFDRSTLALMAKVNCAVNIHPDLCTHLFSMFDPIAVPTKVKKTDLPVIPPESEILPSLDDSDDNFSTDLDDEDEDEMMADEPLETLEQEVCSLALELQIFWWRQRVDRKKYSNFCRKLSKKKTRMRIMSRKKTPLSSIRTSWMTVERARECAISFHQS